MKFLRRLGIVASAPAWVLFLVLRAVLWLVGVFAACIFDLIGISYLVTGQFRGCTRWFWEKTTGTYWEDGETPIVKVPETL